MIIKEPHFNLESIKWYFENKKPSDEYQILSEQILSDLEIERFFENLNCTSSCVGQQYLYDSICRIRHESEACKHESIVDFFKENPQEKTELKRLLSTLFHRNAYYICSLFQDSHYIPSKKIRWLHRIMQFLPISCLLLFIVFSKGTFMALVFLFFIINVFIHYKNKQILSSYLYSIPQYLKLISTAKKLSKQCILEQINPQIQEQIDSLQSLSRKLSFFRFDLKLENDMSSVVFIVTELFRIFFLFEPNIFYNSFQLLNQKKSNIETVFSYVGCVDMLICLSEVEEILPFFCRPILTGQNFKFEQIYHPLIDNCVSNTLDTEGKSILLTGSNMSGKSTFIRTIGLNMLSAQCLNLCFAKTFEAPEMKIHTMINMKDDLAESTSFYMKEVLTIKEMIRESESNLPNLFLLDELFKGTNTLERIAAGKAVLSYLSKNNNYVFASTHDIELADLLASEYNLYHFCEQIDEKELFFDYLLKEGKLNKRNAIRLLEIKNYPSKIIDDANDTLDKLSKIN